MLHQQYHRTLEVGILLERLCDEQPSLFGKHVIVRYLEEIMKGHGIDYFRCSNFSAKVRSFSQSTKKEAPDYGASSYNNS